MLVAGSGARPGPHLGGRHRGRGNGEGNHEDAGAPLARARWLDIARPRVQNGPLPRQVELQERKHGNVLEGHRHQADGHAAVTTGERVSDSHNQHCIE